MFGMKGSDGSAESGEAGGGGVGFLRLKVLDVTATNDS